MSEACCGVGAVREGAACGASAPACLPAGFREFWELRAQAARALGAGDVSMAPVACASPAARYAELVVAAPGARSLRARYVRPATDEAVPLVLAFPDWYQGVRGWHHLTRFVALGAAVVMLDARLLGWDALDVTAGWEQAPEGLAVAGAYTDALRLSVAALELPGIDRTRVCTWGEGLGGAAAIAVAALVGDATWRCAALNPLPAGLEAVGTLPAAGPLAGIARAYRACDPTRARESELAGALAYVDAANLASMLEGELVLGTGAFDEQAPAAGQDLVAERARAAASVRQVRYPRHGHERINEFENELIGIFSR